ncbi:restriction endonuclease [Bifidobacterium sp. 79T10]|nr:restriction endonuclease [Bifidobacterium saguinibicoloris]
MAQSPYFFEHLVGRLLIAMGYGETPDSAAEVTKKSGDEGIDGIVKEDRLGFDSVYYQAKRWDLDRTVGRPEVQAFVGALSGRGADRGLFITTARFSKAAREYAEGIRGQKLVLVDGASLAGLMIDYGVGVSTLKTYEVKAVDTDFFNVA